MILAAAACAAAGISYIFNDDEQSTKTKYETVTVSSTIIDKQGIVKYVIQPRVFNPYLLINQEQKGVSSLIRKYQSNHWILPIENKKQKDNSKEFSVVFFWSVPLKARLLQLSTKPCLCIENSNPFQRNLMKISIGTQNKNLGISPIPSEIALSYSDKYSYQSHKEYDDTLDSLSYNPMINDNVIPIGILKKKKSELDERENHQKRFCFDSNEEKIMRNMIFKNVNLCVENLSKILSESCSNSEEELTTLQKTSSLISAMNNNNINSRLFEHEECRNSDKFCLNNDEELIERLPDGIILHRGKQFGIALGEPMKRKNTANENLPTNSSHSINELNRLLTKTNCSLMRQYKIESIEDLIRLFIDRGQHDFSKLLINLFQVNPSIVEQLNTILIRWSRKLT